MLVFSYVFHDNNKTKHFFSKKKFVTFYGNYNSLQTTISINISTYQ